MDRLNASPRPVLAESGPSQEAHSSQQSPSSSPSRRTMRAGLDLPATRRASNASPTRRSLTALPNELLGSIAAHAKGRATVALAGTSRHLNEVVSPDLDSARLVDRAERARSARDLEPLYENTPDDAPTPGHPQGQPNAIARLPAHQQAEPRAAVAAKLVDLARPLGGPDADSRHDANVFREIEFLLRTLPNEEKLPVLAVLAAKSAFIDPDPGSAGDVHYDIAEMVDSAPPESQPALWKALARNVPELPQDDVPEAFTYMLEMLKNNDPSEALRSDVLKLIAPAVTLFDPNEQLSQSDSLVHAARGLPAELRNGVQDQILNNLARGVVDMSADQAPTVLSYMLRLVEQRDVSQARREDLMKNAFASGIALYEPDERAYAAAELIRAAESLPANHRDSVRAHIRATNPEA